MMDQIVLLISVGPSSQELERLQDFFQAIFYWEPAVASVVLIDDAVESRGLANRFILPADVRIYSLHHPRRGEGVGVWGALTEGILLGLEWIATHEPRASMVLKTDTDALVIGPFAHKASAFFAAHPQVGLIGLYDRHCSGKPRSFKPWDRAILNHALPLGVRRTAIGGRRLRWQLWNAFSVQRRIFRQARSRGYFWGEHCLGGAYILRARTVQALHTQGLLRHASFWRYSYIGEDVIVAAYAKAVGWDLAGFAAPQQVFGIAHVGLPALPEALEAAGYSIIHSIKNEPLRSEEQIRRYFQRKRIAVEATDHRQFEPAEINTSTGKS